MKILINIGHPAQVHLFRNFIKVMKDKGNDVIVTAIGKELVKYLLDYYNIDYFIIGKYPKTLVSKMIFLPYFNWEVLKISMNFKPDIFIGALVSHLSKMLGKNCIVFDDTEHVNFEHRFCMPFIDAILTPFCFKKDLGKKQIRYNGYHELSYLHPNYFTPNPAVLDEIGLSKDDTFIILRFVSWTAIHDIGQHGIRNKIELVRELEKYGQVFITSEGLLPKELEKYKINVSPEKLHDLLYYASLYMGEGGTTAAEAATLGTHAIHTSTTAKYCGIFYELNKYGLMWIFDDEKGSIDKAVEILQKSGIRTEGKRKREKLLNDKINVTAFMVWFIENYPESFRIMKENQEYQDRFKWGQSL